MVLYIAVCLVLSVWCVYDGYVNKGFIAKHTTQEGKADSTLLLNRIGGPSLLLLAIGLTVWLYMIRTRRLIATRDMLITAKGNKIPFDSIEKIDKTHFQNKGFFTITYHDAQDTRSLRLDERDYDDLGPILQRLIEAISS